MAKKDSVDEKAMRVSLGGFSVLDDFLEKIDSPTSGDSRAASSSSEEKLTTPVKRYLSLLFLKFFLEKLQPETDAQKLAYELFLGDCAISYEKLCRVDSGEEKDGQELFTPLADDLESPKKFFSALNQVLIFDGEGAKIFARRPSSQIHYVVGQETPLLRPGSGKKMVDFSAENFDLAYFSRLHSAHVFEGALKTYRAFESAILSVEKQYHFCELRFLATLVLKSGFEPQKAISASLVDLSDLFVSCPELLCDYISFGVMELQKGEPIDFWISFCKENSEIWANQGRPVLFGFEEGSLKSCDDWRVTWLLALGKKELEEGVIARQSLFLNCLRYADSSTEVRAFFKEKFNGGVFQKELESFWPGVRLALSESQASVTSNGLAASSSSSSPASLLLESASSGVSLSLTSSIPTEDLAPILSRAILRQELFFIISRYADQYLSFDKEHRLWVKKGKRQNVSISRYVNRLLSYMNSQVNVFESEIFLFLRSISSAVRDEAFQTFIEEILNKIDAFYRQIESACASVEVFKALMLDPGLRNQLSEMQWRGMFYLNPSLFCELMMSGRVERPLIIKRVQFTGEDYRFMSLSGEPRRALHLVVSNASQGLPRNVVFVGDRFFKRGSLEDRYQLQTEDIQVGLKLLIDRYFLSGNKGFLLLPTVESLAYSSQSIFSAANLDLSNLGNKVVLGIAHVNGNHYIVFCLHRKPSGRVGVLVVDPMAPKTPNDEGKRATLNALHKYLLKFFNDCTISAVELAQQLDDVSCGHLCLQTLEDVLSRSVIERNGEDDLVLDPQQLTVAEVPRNLYRGEFYYPYELSERGRKTRDEISRRLREVGDLFVTTLRFSGGVASYESERLADYSFDFNCREQRSQDEADEALDGLLAIFSELADEHLKKPKAEFNKTLRYPDVDTARKIIDDFFEVASARADFQDFMAQLDNRERFYAPLSEFINRQLDEGIYESLLEVVPSILSSAVDYSGKESNEVVESILGDRGSWCYLLFERLQKQQQEVVRRRLVAAVEKRIKQDRLRYFPGQIKKIIQDAVVRKMHEKGLFPDRSELDTLLLSGAHEQYRFLEKQNASLFSRSISEALDEAKLELKLNIFSCLFGQVVLTDAEQIALLEQESDVISRTLFSLLQGLDNAYKTLGKDLSLLLKQVFDEKTAELVETHASDCRRALLSSVRVVPSSSHSASSSSARSSSHSASTAEAELNRDLFDITIGLGSNFDVRQFFSDDSKFRERFLQQLPGLGLQIERSFLRVRTYFSCWERLHASLGLALAGVSACAPHLRKLNQALLEQRSAFLKQLKSSGVAALGEIRQAMERFNDSISPPLYDLLKIFRNLKDRRALSQVLSTLVQYFYPENAREKDIVFEYLSLTALRGLFKKLFPESLRFQLQEKKALTSRELSEKLGRIVEKFPEEVELKEVTSTLSSAQGKSSVNARDLLQAFLDALKRRYQRLGQAALAEPSTQAISRVLASLYAACQLDRSPYQCLLPNLVHDEFLSGACFESVPLNSCFLTADGLHLIYLPELLRALNEHVKTVEALKNPYTRGVFSSEDQGRLRENDYIKTRFAVVSNQRFVNPDQRSIATVARFVNGSVFPYGLTRYYSPEDTRAAQVAFELFRAEFAQLSFEQREALNNTVIWLDGSSRKFCFVIADIGEGRVCVTELGRYLVKFLYDHGGLNQLGNWELRSWPAKYPGSYGYQPCAPSPVAVEKRYCKAMTRVQFLALVLALTHYHEGSGLVLPLLDALGIEPKRVGIYQESPANALVRQVVHDLSSQEDTAPKAFYRRFKEKWEENYSNLSSALYFVVEALYLKPSCWWGGLSATPEALRRHIFTESDALIYIRLSLLLSSVYRYLEYVFSVSIFFRSSVLKGSDLAFHLASELSPNQVDYFDKTAVAQLQYCQAISRPLPESVSSECIQMRQNVSKGIQYNL